MIKKKNIQNIVFWLVITFIPYFQLYSQFEPHPELEWYSYETKHFYIHYHKGSERSASTVAKIAEDIYKPITELYDYEPTEKVSIIITDVSDVANGATDFYGNRIEIFASALDYDLRGTHNWLRNVVTHEFTHMIQLQASMKFPRRMPAVYLQWLEFEKERRPDVLYGYPNVLVSYPISGIGVPAWFAEGTAQYQRQQLSYEYWDAQRDMIMRMYVEDDKMLTWNEMGQFSSITSLKAESIYNSGYALVRYIAEKYGENKLKEISQNLRTITNFSISTAINKAINKDGKELYDEWKNFLKNDYSRRLSSVKKDRIEGKTIESIGFANYYPQFSPDGKKIAYLSNQNYDYSSTGLYVYDIEKKDKEIIATPVSSNFSWSPDGKKIIYAKRNSPPSIKGITLFDIYEYNLKDKEERRLTENLRTYSPSYSPDGKNICFLISKDGTFNLYISNSGAKNPVQITFFKDGEQLYNPKFSPDGKRIILDYSFENSRKIAEVNIENKKFDFIFKDIDYDVRNPVFSSDGTKIYFSSNRTGIFNIYSYEILSGETLQITNVLGGAFMPSSDDKFNLTYAEYKSDGFKISLLKNFSGKKPDSLGAYNRPDILVKKYSVIDTVSSVSKSGINWKELKNFNDRNIPLFNKKLYKSLFTKTFLFPVLRYDNYSKENKVLDAIKPGLYLYSDEIIDRFSIFAGASINRKLERDIFLQFQYKNGFPVFKDFFARKLSFIPVFTFEAFNVSRKTDALLIAGVDTINVGVTYDLLAMDLSMATKIFNTAHNLKFMYTFSKYASRLDGFLIPQSGIQVSASSQDYFKAHEFSLEYNYEGEHPYRNSDINFIGRKFNIKYNYEISQINPEYEVENGNLITKYKTNKLHKIDADLTQSFGLFNNRHSLSFKIRSAVIFGLQVDDFYNFYAAGLPGMKGYPFFSLGGGRVATLNMTYRFPLLSGIDTRISPLYLDKLYLSLYGDIGNAWEEDKVKLSDFKKDAGAELRLQEFSFYVFPTSIFFNAAYGFDSFTKVFQGKQVTYGKEWRLYFGMLFDFDL